MDRDISLEEIEPRIRDVSLDADPDTMRRDGCRVVDPLVERRARLRSSRLAEGLSRVEKGEGLASGSVRIQG